MKKARQQGEEARKNRKTQAKIKIKDGNNNQEQQSTAINSQRYTHSYIMRNTTTQKSIHVRHTHTRKNSAGETYCGNKQEQNRSSGSTAHAEAAWIAYNCVKQ